MGQNNPHQEYFTSTTIKLRLENLFPWLLRNNLLGLGQHQLHDLSGDFPPLHFKTGMSGQFKLQSPSPAWQRFMIIIEDNGFW
jgi:hypothetical protein